MSISPFSLILCIFVIYLFYILLVIQNKRKFIFLALGLLLVFEAFIGRGYFIDLGLNRVLYYNEFLLLLFFPVFLVFIFNKRFQKKSYFIVVVGFLLSIAVGLFLLELSPPDYRVIPIGISIDDMFKGRASLEFVELNINHLQKILRVLLYIPILLFLGSNYIDKQKIYDLIIIVTKIFCLILFVEIFFKVTGFDYYDNFLQFIFNDNRSILSMREGSFTLLGLTREPSHLAYGFFMPLFLLATKKVNDKLLLVTIILLLILSFSFRNFMLAFLIIILYFIYTESNVKIQKYHIKMAFKYVLIIVTFMLILYYLVPFELIEHNYQRLASFYTGEHVGSEAIRIWSVSENMRYFFDRPLFGLGLGSTISNGFVPSMLANIGIIGAFLWIIMHISILKVRLSLIAAVFMFIFLFFSGDIGWLYSFKGLVIFLLLDKNILAKEL